MVAAVLNELCNRRQQQAVLFAELLQCSETHHGSVVMLNLANDANGLAASKARKVNGGFGVSGTLQHATLTRTQWENMTRSCKCFERHIWVCNCPHCGGAVGSTNASCCSFNNIHCHCVCRALAFCVLFHHQRKTQLFTSFVGEWRTNHARGVANNEGKLLWRCKLCGHNEVAFVFAVFVVHDDNDFSAANGGDDVFNGV